MYNELFQEIFHRSEVPGNGLVLSQPMLLRTIKQLSMSVTLRSQPKVID